MWTSSIKGQFAIAMLNHQRVNNSNFVGWYLYDLDESHWKSTVFVGPMVDKAFPFRWSQRSVGAQLRCGSFDGNVGQPRDRLGGGWFFQGMCWERWKPWEFHGEVSGKFGTCHLFYGSTSIFDENMVQEAIFFIYMSLPLEDRRNSCNFPRHQHLTLRSWVYYGVLI